MSPGDSTQLIEQTGARRLTPLLATDHETRTLRDVTDPRENLIDRGFLGPPNLGRGLPVVPGENRDPPINQPRSDIVTDEDGGAPPEIAAATRTAQRSERRARTTDPDKDALARHG